MISSNPNLNPIPMEILSFIGHLIQGGLGNLGAYLAAHVLLCLIPAFFIAGAMGSLIPKETIARFLGRDTPKWISYPAAALAGIHRKGAGLGPAVTFLFFAPAANILALVYTGGEHNVVTTVAAGRIVLENGKITGVDEAEVLAGAQAAAERIRERAGIVSRR